MMSERVIFEDPRDLFFGMNDLAERVRSLRQEESVACLPEIQKHIEGLIETLDSFGESVNGTTYQSVVLAREALRIAHRSAAEYSLRSTAEAVQLASVIMRDCGPLAVPLDEQVV
jgi:hypothetical protein